MEDKDLISIVTPVYGDKKLVRMLYDRILMALSNLDVDFEIIMVNDACPYGSGEEIENLAKEDKRVKFIDLSRNFGQHYAIKAGIDNANGDWVVVMDCDLQDNPEDIPRLYAKAKEGYNVVFGKRINRKESFLKKILSKTASVIGSLLTPYKVDKQQGNFCMLSQKVVAELKQFNEQNFIFSTMIAWLGYEIGWVEIIQEERIIGCSGYNFLKGFKHFMYLSISNSNKPLVFAAYCAFIMFFLCFGFVGKLVFDYWFLSKPMLGWTSLMVSIFLIGGLLFAYLSILGLYIGQIFRATKSRPLYIIKRKMNLD